MANSYLQDFKDMLFKTDCSVYIACKMSGRDRHEQITRAKYLCSVLAAYGLTPISPVIEEHVEDAPGPLLTNDPVFLRRVWTDDKEIMAYRAHVTLMDGGDEGSVGMGREYGFNRYGLWKPTVTLWSRDRGLTVAEWEDDGIFMSPHLAAAYIAAVYGTRLKRWKWRFSMLKRTLPRFIWRQLWAWS